MEICKGCNWNLNNQKDLFESGKSKMFNTNCENAQFFSGTCLMQDEKCIFARHIINYTINRNGYEFYEFYELDKDK